MGAVSSHLCCFRSPSTSRAAGGKLEADGQNSGRANSYIEDPTVSPPNRSAVVSPHTVQKLIDEGQLTASLYAVLLCDDDDDEIVYFTTR